MKSKYISGLIAGASLMLALVVLSGAKDNEVGRYAISTANVSNHWVAETIIDTKTGKVISRTKRDKDEFDSRWVGDNKD